LEQLNDEKVELKKALRASYLKALEREKRARESENQTNFVEKKTETDRLDQWWNDDDAPIDLPAGLESPIALKK